VHFNVFLSITNKMQRYTMIFITINALHVSGGSSAHHQELKTVYTTSGICRTFTASYRLLTQLVSSLSVQYSTVCRIKADLLSSGIMYSCLQGVTILDAVIIQFVLPKMGMLMLETCRGL